jgi:hypothetical protein
MPPPTPTPEIEVSGLAVPPELFGSTSEVHGVAEGVAVGDPVAVAVAVAVALAVAVTDGDAVAEGPTVAVALAVAVAVAVAVGEGETPAIPLIETSSIAKPPKLTELSLSKWKVTWMAWPAKSVILAEYLPQPADAGILVAAVPTASVMVAFSEFQTMRVWVGLAISVTRTQMRSKLMVSIW